MQPTTRPRVGIFGGTFDPVHLGHLILAEQCREQGKLDQVWFIPAARPPHKQGRSLTRFEQRVEMLSLAIAGQPAFRIDELEKDRTGISYTVDTLEEITRRDPNLELHFIMGSDSLPDLPYWHKPDRILELATLLVAARPSWPVLSGDQIRASLKLPPSAPVRIEMIDTLFVDISSTDLRRRVREGRSLRYLVPRAVECYIDNHHLYRADEHQPATGPDCG